MATPHSPTEPTIIQRVFEAWSVEIPGSFEATFVEEETYWHSYDASRSVSLTSVLVTEAGRPVRAERILSQIPALEGSPIDELPTGLIGLAVTSAINPPARASRALSGVLASEGRLLIVTIQSDDHEWARRVWRSIRGHATPQPPLRGRRAGRDGPLCH